MEKAKRVSIINKLGENIFTRMTMRDFLSETSKLKEKKVILDFNKVKFISRSCADEYVKFIENSKKEIQSVNQSPEVKIMIQAVKNRMNTILVSEEENENSGKILCKN
jgi:anti-anti-sigma regulatory factor